MMQRKIKSKMMQRKINESSSLSETDKSQSKNIIKRSNSFDDLPIKIENNTKCSNRRRRVQRSVSFDDSQNVVHDIKRVPKRLGRKKIWHSSYDLEEIKMDHMEQAWLILEGKDRQEDDDTERGLEHFLHSDYQSNYKQGLHNVLREQDRQKYNGIVDPEIISELYRQNGCQQKATERAIADEKKVSIIIQEDNNLSRKICNKKNKLPQKLFAMTHKRIGRFTRATRV